MQLSTVVRHFFRGSKSLTTANWPKEKRQTVGLCNNILVGLINVRAWHTTDALSDRRLHGAILHITARLL